MQKVYSKKLLVSFLALCIYGTSDVLGQACVDGGPNCGTTTQDFNTSTGGFNSVSFVRDPANGDMRVASTVQNASYTLISPVYSLTMNGTAFIGFDLTGTTATGAANGGLAGIRLSIFSGGTEIAGCDLGAPTTLGIVCSQIDDGDLVSGTAVTYRITFSTTDAASGGDAKILIVDDFSNGSAAAPLPVDLKSFDAKRSNGNSVVLNWETVSESNVKGFEIQRKASNGSFENIAFVPSKAVNGSSSTTLQYNFTDLNNNNSGASQYRIVSVDLDGKTKISIIRSVDGLKGLAKILIYPNPSNGPVNVVFPNSDTRDIQLTDLLGRVHASWRSYKSQDLVLSKLKPGNYTLRVTNVVTNQKEVLRLSITK
jgi:hypothetical protein